MELPPRRPRWPQRSVATVQVAVAPSGRFFPRQVSQQISTESCQLSQALGEGLHLSPAVPATQPDRGLPSIAPPAAQKSGAVSQRPENRQSAANFRAPCGPLPPPSSFQADTTDARPVPRAARRRGVMHSAPGDASLRSKLGSSATLEVRAVERSPAAVAPRQSSLTVVLVKFCKFSGSDAPRFVERQAAKGVARSSLAFRPPHPAAAAPPSSALPAAPCSGTASLLSSSRASPPPGPGSAAGMPARSGRSAPPRSAA